MTCNRLCCYEIYRKVWYDQLVQKGGVSLGPKQANPCKLVTLNLGESSFLDYAFSHHVIILFFFYVLLISSLNKDTN